jgi:dTDP-4-amino-4,6-dideoxyglucose formyltransferase
VNLLLNPLTQVATMKKILVITDNSYLCLEFSKIVKSKDYSNFTFYYACSEITDPSCFSGINIFQINLKNIDSINHILETYELVLSIHCKQLFPEKLVNGVKCININPGYNPINRGWYPQVFAIIYDLPIGATIHEIDNELDNGNIIARKFVEKLNIDTSLSLYNRILKAEIELLKSNLLGVLNQTYSIILPEKNGNIFLKKDFNSLCKIDLDEKLTAKEFINKIRALTHGNYSNAFFEDEQTKEKIYIKIELKKLDD